MHVCVYVKGGYRKVGHRVSVCVWVGGGVPVPFCILNSSTSVQPFSVVAAAGCDVCVYVCVDMCVCVYERRCVLGVFVSVCICACSAEGAGCYPHLN